MDEGNCFKKNRSNEKYLISVIFISYDESIIDSIICEKSEIFLDVLELLSRKYPELSAIDHEYYINGRIIEKNKTLIENNISNNSIIVMKWS